MLEVDDLRALVEVVDRGSFSAAAPPLGLSKQGVSRRVMALETALGARLLVRTTRRLSATADGVALVERARRILADLAEAEQSVAQAGPLRGRLRISAPVTFGTLYLAPVLSRFLALHPGVELDIELNDRVVDIVGEGYDLALRFGVLADSTLIARRIAELRLMVCASPAYLAVRGTPAHPGDLRQHDCLIYTLGRGATWSFVIGRQRRTVTVQGRLRANSGELLREAAVAGLGIVQLPEFMVAAALAAGTLQPLLQGFLRQDGAVYAVTPPHRQHTLAVRSLVDHLVASFAPTPWTVPGTPASASSRSTAR